MSEGGEGISLAEREIATEASGNINKALESLRNRNIESITMRNGNMLIQSEIRDLQEHQELDNSEKLQQLRELDSALLEIDYNDENEINYDTAKRLRKYFREKKSATGYSN